MNYLRKKLLLMLFLPLSCLAWVQQSHLSSGWYPGTQDDLQIVLQKIGLQARTLYQANVNKNSIKAIIVPHAGFEYSGAVAAGVYELLYKAPIKRVILLAPDHQGVVEGVALPNFNGYKVPNGVLGVDKKVIQKLIKKNSFSVNKTVFTTEHSLEVQLPFIAYYLPHAKIVPLIVGSLSCSQAAQVAQDLRGFIDNTTLLVVSSDFTHYGKQFNYTPFSEQIAQNIRSLDSQAVHIIEQAQCDKFEQFIQTTGATICGVNPIKILLNLLATNAFGSVEPRLIAYATSAKITDDNSVSYVGMLFTTEQLATKPIEEQLTQQEKRGLLQESYDIVNNLFTGASEELFYPIASFGVTRPHGLFVTLRNSSDNALRGCIGRVVSNEPLYKLIPEVTNDTALRDSRFNPVTQAEIPGLKIELSILGPQKQIKNYQQIRLGKDGVALEHGGHSALFLPEVPLEFNWTREQMLDQLAQKAGLPTSAWQNSQAVVKIFSTATIK